MLVGSFSYYGFNYSVRGYDFGDSLDFLLTPVLPKDKKFLDKGIIYSDGNIDAPVWSDFWVNVGVGAIKCTCDTATEESEDGGKPTKLKNQVNKDLLVCFGSIVRGMKAGCTGINLVKDSDDLFSTGFNPRSSFTYEYEHGSITTKLQLIEKLDYVVDREISLHLEDDYSFKEQIYGTTNPYKFKLDLSEFVGATREEDDSDWDFSSGDRLYTLQEIIEMNPTKSYVWLYERKYYMVKDIDMLEQVCRYLWQFDRLAFDTETTGLKINITSRYGKGDQLVGMIFSAEPGIAYYIPFKHKKFKNVCEAHNIEFIIEKYLKPLLEEKKILCHNGSFDWKVAHIYNICMNLIDDTYIKFKVTIGDENPQLYLGLKPLTKMFLGRDSFELSDFVVGKFGSDNIKFWDFDEESAKLYACPDCDNLIELDKWAEDNRLLEKYKAKKIYQIEVLFSVVIAYQEFYGHHVKIESIDDLVKELIETKEYTYKKMVEIAGHDFNPNSTKDLPKVMYEELGMPIFEYTDTGNPSTGKEARKKLLDERNPDGSRKYPFVEYLSDYKDASTLESNFTKNIDKFSTEDGLMFSEVQQFLKTGRVSTSNPNYQGYSDTVKKYITPRNGYYAMDADYSTIEARIMCSMAGCQGMVEKLKNPDTDYHRQKASDMFGVPYELVTKQLRQQSKGVNFGILYGLGDPNLGVNLFGTKTPENTRKAAKLKEMYYIGMEELRPFTQVSRDQGITLGYSTTYFGRRRWYNQAKVRKDTIMRQSCNARIQGTAADLYKLGMVRLFEQIKRRGWVGKFLISAFVHDECYCEVSKSINPFLAMKVIRNAMMIEIKNWTTLFTGLGVGSTWYEAKKTEIPVQVQESLVDRYSENCPDWWDGNTAQLSKFVVDNIMDYKRDRILGYLKDEANWGKVLQPTENELAHELLEDISKGQDVEGLVCKDVAPNKDMLENLRLFCVAFGVLDLYAQANIKKPEESASSSVVVEDDSIEDMMQHEDEIDAVQLLKQRVETMGTAFTSVGAKKVIYIQYNENNVVLMNLVSQLLSKYPGDIPVRTFKGGEEFELKGVSVNFRVYSELMKLYLTSKNMQKLGG